MNANKLVMILSIFSINFSFCMQESDKQICNRAKLFQYADCCIGKDAFDKLQQIIKEEKAAGRAIDPVDNYDGYTYTPFLSALRVGNAQVAKIFLEAGCDHTLIEAREGKSAAHLAAQAGDIETVQTLLKRNVSFEAADSEGNTPLHLLTSKGRYYNQSFKISDLELRVYQALCADIILEAQLEKYKSEADIAIVNGARALGCESWPRVEVVRSMDINEMNDTKGEATVARFLAARNNKEKTPVQLAQENNPSVLSVFVSYGAEVNASDMPRMAKAQLQCMRKLNAEIVKNNGSDARMQSIIDIFTRQMKKS